VPEEGAPADFAAAWLADRRARAGKAEKSVVGTDPAGSGSPTSPGPVKDEAAAARRVQQRAQRVANGLDELRSWLRDQVLVGLSATAAAPSARPPSGPGSAARPPARGGGPPTTPTARGHADEIAARMVDAQAPGVAAVLRGLSVVPSSGEGWPGRLLAEYAQLHLLTRAHQRLGDLPPDLAATVRSRVGYPVGRQDVLARQAVTDHWAVLGVRDLLDGHVPGRRLWLRGRDSGRWAMLLTFAAPGGAGGAGGWQDPDTARLRPGTELHASLHYYPGQPALRATVGERHAQPTRPERPPAGGDGAAHLARYATGLEQEPWLTVWPALLTGTPVPPDGGRPGSRWRLVDPSGAALPLAERESLWTLLAVSGGYPVTVAGEWHPDGLLPLAVWHRDRAVAL
jgi:hypothetical protein